MIQSTPRIRRTFTLVLAISVILGLLDAWAYRFVINADGVSYLDMGDNLLKGDILGFINAYWSPLYPALLGLANRMLRPSIQHQYLVAHLVNLLVFVFSTLCFSAFCWQLLDITPATSSSSIGIPVEQSEELIVTLIWLFTLLYWWASLRLIGLRIVTPDLLMMGFMFICLAIILKSWASPQSGWGWCALLGMCAGVGYLSKAALFPLSPILILAASFNRKSYSPGQVCGRFAVGMAGLLIVAAPWVLGLHYKYGRLTFADSGKLARIWFTGRFFSSVTHWQGENPTGTPEHTTRVILRDPTVYEFATPIEGTYPPWSDPAYWNSGMEYKVHIPGHLRQLWKSSELLSGELFRGVYGVISCLFLVRLFTRASRNGCRSTITWLGEVVRPVWPLFLFCVLGVAMYAVIYTETRYIAGFCLGAFALGTWSVLRSMPSEAPEGLRGWQLTAGFVFWLSFLPGFALAVRSALPVHTLKGMEVVSLGNRWQNLAEELQHLGVQENTRIAVVGDSYPACWARLAGAKIVAEVLGEEAAALRQPGRLQRVLEAFRAAGASHAIFVPGCATDEAVNWESTTSGYKVLRLTDAPSHEGPSS